MYFDFDDRYRDIEPVGSAINRRDGVALSIIVHAARPRAVGLRAAISRAIPACAGRPAAAAGTPAAARMQPRFVFVQPSVDLPPLRKPDRVEMSDVDRSARSPEKTPSLTNPLPSARGNSTERTESTPEEKMRGQGPAPQPAPPAPPVETPSIVDQRQADMAMMQKPQVQPPPGGSARRSAEEPAEVRAERVVQQPEGPGAGIRAAAVRHEGRRVRSVDPPLRLAGAPQLVRADGGDEHARPRRDHLQRASQRRAHRRHGDSPVGNRLVQHGGRQRAPRIESDDAAAAGVSGRQGVLHGHVLLQRIPPGNKAKVPEVPEVPECRVPES